MLTYDFSGPGCFLPHQELLPVGGVEIFLHQLTKSGFLCGYRNKRQCHKLALEYIVSSTLRKLSNFRPERSKAELEGCISLLCVADTINLLYRTIQMVFIDDAWAGSMLARISSDGQ